MSNHPHYEEPCEECPEPGPPLMEESEDETQLTLALLTDLYTPRRIAVSLTFEAAGEDHSIKSLVRQYRSIADVPNSEGTKREIVQEMKDAISILNDFEAVIADGIATTIRGIMDAHPSIEVRDVTD